MTSHPQRRYSRDDYFSLEEGSSVRHEFFNGEIFAMAGGTVAHNQIVANVIRELGAALRSKNCRALGSDMRLLTPGGLLTYPDVMVICGPVELADGRRDVVTNPAVLVEVLSDATRGYDLADKFEHYKAIPTLRDYLTIEQRSVGVQWFARADGSWTATTFNDRNQSVALSSIGVHLSLAEIYDKALE